MTKLEIEQRSHLCKALQCLGAEWHGDKIELTDTTPLELKSFVVSWRITYGTKRIWVRKGNNTLQIQAAILKLWLKTIEEKACTKSSRN